MLLDRTSFYAEQGGQTFDEGYMVREDESAEDVSAVNNRESCENTNGYMWFIMSFTDAVLGVFCKNIIRSEVLKKQLIRDIF